MENVKTALQGAMEKVTLNPKPDAMVMNQCVDATFTNRGGKFRIRATAPKNASEIGKLCHKIVKWNTSQGNLHGLIGAKMFADQEDWELAENTALVLCHLFGIKTAVNNWRNALGGSE